MIEMASCRVTLHYATITISGDQIPDNRYYELDVTKLIQEYANGKSEKYWFLNKGPRGRQKLYCFLQFYMEKHKSET